MKDILEKIHQVVEQLLADKIEVNEIYSLMNQMTAYLSKVNNNEDLMNVFNRILKEIVVSLEKKDYVYLLDLIKYSLVDLVITAA